MSSSFFHCFKTGTILKSPELKLTQNCNQPILLLFFANLNNKKLLKKNTRIWHIYRSTSKMMRSLTNVEFESTTLYCLFNSMFTLVPKVNPDYAGSPSVFTATFFNSIDFPVIFANLEKLMYPI